MPSKFSHRKYYTDSKNRKVIGKFKITSGMIVNFRYPGTDSKPLVFVMDTDEYVSPAKNKSFSGINLNYLSIGEINKFFIQVLSRANWEESKETGLPKVDLWDEEDPGTKPITIYNSFVKRGLLSRKECWRTYKYNKVSTVEQIKFDFSMPPLTALKENKSLKKISKSTMYRKLKQPTIKNLRYSKPNFSFEWGEARRYPEFVLMGKDGWIEQASRGYKTKYSTIKNYLGNVDLNFDGLHKEKKQRFEHAYNKGTIETPIVVKFSETDYDLVAGNTRLSGCVYNGQNPDIWVVTLPIEQGDENED